MVDLHLHTMASDGTDEDWKLIEKLRKAGIRTFSVTDHDTIGAVSGMEFWAPEDMMYIRGVEFSCLTEVRNCHILGYGFNKDVRAFGRMVEKANRQLMLIAEAHLEYIAKEFGIEISTEDKQEITTHFGLTMWKDRLAGNLVSLGYAETKDEAAEKYIKPCKTNHLRPDAREAIQAILAAGGIPVWAHPYGGAGKREMHGEEFEKQLQILLEAGLQGIECYYSAYDEEQVKSLLEVARKHNLWVSGGSDYHGENKDVALGTLNSYGKVVSEEELTIIAELRRRQKEHPFPLIEVEEWHNYGDSFWLMPVKARDISKNCAYSDNLDCMEDEEISISENSFEDFLYPIFKKHFDKDLPENQHRWESYPSEERKYVKGFEWYLTDNFYTYDSMDEVLKEIEETAAILEKDYDDPRLDELRKGFGNLPDYMPGYWRRKEMMSEDEADRMVRENKAYILDFYRRFVDSIRSAMKAGEAAGYSLIFVCGP